MRLFISVSNICWEHMKIYMPTVRHFCSLHKYYKIHSEFPIMDSPSFQLLRCFKRQKEKQTTKVSIFSSHTMQLSPTLATVIPACESQLIIL